jgi:pimeloyl-ACP methyl ester carboxylesterase
MPDESQFLEVPGARLSYETRGSGPVLLMVPGANGTADGFTRVAEQLAAHYTVITYDRRGFSRSQLDGSQDYTHRLDTDADDVRRLIEHVSHQPATVFGTSSGAIVAFQVLLRHPSTLQTLVPHEPPAVRLLPDGQKWIDFFLEVYDLSRQSGPELALRKFGEKVLTNSDLQAMASAPKNKDALSNVTYWFDHEVRQYPVVDLDLDTLKTYADRMLLLAGRESRGYPAHEVSVDLANKLGLGVIEVPGGHLGFLSQPTEFARRVVQALSTRAERAEFHKGMCKCDDLMA